MAMNRGLWASSAVLLALLQSGCEPPYEPNWLYRGQWIDIDGRDREADETCAGTFEYLDRYAGALSVEFGANQHLPPYRWYSPEQYYTDAPCGTDPRPTACAWPDGADTPFIPHEHEVVHLADSLVGECPNIIAEGLADFYSPTGRTPGSDAIERLTTRLADPAKNIRPGEYAVAGRFAAFLVERFGLQAILDVCSITGRYPDADGLSTAFETVFGLASNALIDEFAAQPGWCNSFEWYQSRVYACGAAEAAPHAGIAGGPGEPLEVTYEFGCASGAVGPRDSKIWIHERVDFAVDGIYIVGLRDGPELGDLSEGIELILAKCEPCGWVQSYSAEDFFVNPVQFDAGRHSLEIQAPEDYEGTLHMTIERSD